MFEYKYYFTFSTRITQFVCSRINESNKSFEFKSLLFQYFHVKLLNHPKKTMNSDKCYFKAIQLTLQL